MTAKPPQSIPPSLSDVLVYISSGIVLSPVRQRDYRSAVLRFSRFMGKPAEMIPADIRHLSHCFTGINPAQNRVSIKTLRNIKSNLLGAVLLFNESQKKAAPRKQPLLNEWKILFSKLPDKRRCNGLSRFIHYSSLNHISSSEVDDAVVLAFVGSLSSTSFLSDQQIRESHRRTTRLWNEVARSELGWPETLLSVPDYRKPRTTYPLTAFPDLFQLEVQRYLAWLEDTDPFASHRPPRRCKPRTIELRRSQIQIAASALVQRGRDISKVISFSDLVDAESLKEILRFHLDKHNDEVTSFIHGLAIILISIAEHWLRLPQEIVSEMKQIKQKLGPLSVGMTDKNKRCLRQFDDDHNRRLLLDLPDRLMKLAQAQSGERAAITVQKAIVIELLLMVPLRMANVISLQFDKHLVKPGGNRGNYLLVIPGDEIKNEQPFEVQLPQLLTNYIDIYRELHIPVITIPDNVYLFPNRKDGHKVQATLSQQIKETIRQHTGLDMTGHLFRHLCGKFYLEANPGQYEIVRQILGHKNLKTTVAFYTGTNTKESTRVFDTLILGERERLSAKLPNGKEKGEK